MRPFEPPTSAPGRAAIDLVSRAHRPAAAAIGAAPVELLGIGALGLLRRRRARRV